MKKNLLSKLGLLVLCFGLTAGLSACGGGEAAPEQQTEEGATDDGADADAEGTEDSAEGEGEATE